MRRLGRETKRKEGKKAKEIPFSFLDRFKSLDDWVVGRLMGRYKLPNGSLISREPKWAGRGIGRDLFAPTTPFHLRLRCACLSLVSLHLVGDSAQTSIATGNSDNVFSFWGVNQTPTYHPVNQSSTYHPVRREASLSTLTKSEERCGSIVMAPTGRRDFFILSDACITFWIFCTWPNWFGKELRESDLHEDEAKKSCLII